MLYFQMKNDLEEVMNNKERVASKMNGYVVMYELKR